MGIGKEILRVYSCTSGPRGWRAETRTLPTMTRSLKVVRDQLVARRMTMVAMLSA